MIRSRSRLVLATVAALAVPLQFARAQGPAVMAELAKDMHGVHAKLVQLAKAMPADKSDWRPGAGVRSVREVFLHVASDNYLMPSFAGVAPDPASGINPKDFKTLDAYEHQKLDPAAVAAALDKSFGHLAQAMGNTTEAQLDTKVKFFGQEMTTRALWIATVTHLHEHLGQAIAYARMNGVTPPWSKGN